MFLLGKQIDKIRTFQAHVIRLATETEMRSARCKMLYPGRTIGSAERMVATGEYADELKRAKRKSMPVSKGAVHGAPLVEKKGLADNMVYRLPHPGEHLPGQVAQEDGPA